MFVRCFFYEPQILQKIPHYVKIMVGCTLQYNDIYSFNKTNSTFCINGSFIAAFDKIIYGSFSGYWGAEFPNIHLCIAVVVPFLRWIIFALPSPRGPPSRALERPRASFAKNFATTSTTLSPLPRFTTHIIFSEELPWNRVLNWRQIHCDQSDTFNVSRAMNHLSLALGHKPSQFPEPMAQ